MASAITEFYKNKTIFLTGGNGYVGSMLIEKLLRITELKCIYILIRPKKEKDISSRIEAFTSTPLFSECRKVNPKFLDKIVPINGDCGFPDLGISPADRKRLTNEVQILIHSAATVHFDVPLNLALNTNTRATRTIVELAKEMPRLESFVFVSTIFSNFVGKNVNESFHPEYLTCTADQVLKLNEELDSEVVNKMEPALMPGFPNTYVYSKALAEQVLQKEAKDLPLCIFRPGMILPTTKDPIQGWTDNLYGPVSIIYGAGLGVLRVTVIDRKCMCNVVPADYCVNIILSSAWHAAQEFKRHKAMKLQAPDPPVYNFVPTNENPLKWGKFVDLIKERKPAFPLNQLLWYPFLICTRNMQFFTWWSILYHHIPGFFIDALLRLKGQKPRMKKLYKKIDTSIQNVHHFGVTDWNFEIKNFSRLLKEMSPEDRKIFFFDLNDLNWSEYIEIVLSGIRVYLAKEEFTEASLESGRKRMDRFRILNYIVHFVMLCIPLGLALWVLMLLNIV